ncbi:MAG: MopE-related protein [Nannocystaceae bacterium]
MALAQGCGTNCIDDGFAGSQKTEACMASATATESDSTTGSTSETTTTTTTTATTTMSSSVSDSDSESTGGATMYCKDADGDGQGDPTMCIPADGMPPDGWVPNGDDCDDTDPATYVGSAELEDPLACMTDVDNDGWGEPNPKPGVVPGTDCDDSNPYAFPGAAEIEDPNACMEDEDDDGWGDSNPPPGVTPGSDCVDTDPFTFPGAAEQEDMMACMTDADGDGYGDNDPPPGSTPGTDCDDGEPGTFPGSAPNDDPVACMKDVDDDDWGDSNPPPGVTPGTDCDDTDDHTYPGAAENEIPPGECMRDVDEDGWGDDNPPPGVTPGIDCNDTEASVFLGCATCNPDEKFCIGDELHQCNGTGTGEKLDEVCMFGCDMPGQKCFDELSVDAGPSICIDKGQMAQLQAVAMGGDGSYMWDWTPANSLDNPNIDNPVATPANQTTYTVTVTDGINNMAMDTVSVFLKDTPLALSDVECAVTNFDWELPANANWAWNPNLVELCETVNSTPTARFCGWSLDNANIQGRFQIKNAGGDNDYIGFLWGIQPFDVMTEDPTQFYFFSWKQGDQLGFCPNSPQSGQAGMMVKRIDVTDPVNQPMTCADMHSPLDTPNSVALAVPDNWTKQGWVQNTEYIFDLTHTSKDFTVKIIQANNMQVIAEQTFNDATYPNGQVGFYAYSQVNSCFSNFKTSCL